jgi:hypothetical protein
VFESYSQKKQRIDANAAHEHGGHFEFLRLFGTHEEYEIRDNKTCHHRDFNRTMYPAFEWVAQAKKSDHPCHARGRKGEIGELWMHDGHFKDVEIIASLCCDKAGNEPYWTDFAVKGRKEQRLVNFQNFKAGNPPAKDFDVPKACK